MRASHGFVTVGVAVSVVAVILGALFGSGNADQLIDLLPGRAWLASDERGAVTLVNGATGEAEFEMRFTGADGDELEVVQGDEGVFVVNRTTGEITRIDGATQTIAGSIKVDVGDEPLFLIGGGRAYLVLKAIGTVQEIDPSSPDLAPRGGVVALGGAIGSAVVDDGGVLAAAVVGSGVVAFVDGQVVAGQIEVNPPGDPLTVTLVDDVVMAVAQDVRAGEVEALVLGPRGVQRSQQVDVPAEGELAVAPKMDGDRLWLLHRESAELAGVPVDGGEVRTLGLEFARGDELGAPLPNGSYVYVPNFDQGALLKIDAETGAFVDVIPVGDDTEDFEAFVENGRVWGNDPTSGSAVVIDRDGNVTTIEKYAPGIPSNDGTGIPVPLDLDQPVGEQVPTEQGRGGDRDQDPGDPGGGGPGGPTDLDRGGDPGDPGPLDPFVPDPPPDPSTPSNPGGGPSSTTTTTGNPQTPPPPPPPPAAGVPGVPGAVSAAGGDASATVSWLPALANGSPVTAYLITASTGGSQTVSGTTTSVTFTGLTNGEPVSFSVHAENAIGVGPAAVSNTVTPAYAIPGVPTNVTFTLTQPSWQYAFVTVSWDLPVENPGAVADWVITCASSIASTPYELVVAAGARTALFDSLPAFEDYFCGIQARAVDGTRGPDATMASGSTIRPLVAPYPPDCLNPASMPAGNGQYRSTCNITPPSSSPAPITGFIVEVHDGVAIIDHQVVPGSSGFTWTCGVLQTVGASYTILWYSYFTDPISGLTVTSEGNGWTL